MELSRVLKIVFLILCGAIMLACGQNASKNLVALDNNVYRVFPVQKPLRINADIEKDEWKHIPWSPLFVDMVSGGEANKKCQTRMKCAYSQEYLFLIAEIKGAGFTANHLERDDKYVYKDDCFEVFIDPNADGQDYYEIQLNSKSNICDLQMSQPYNDGGQANYQWNLSKEQIQSKIIEIDGVETWILEAAFLWKDFGYQVSDIQKGLTFKANFSRIEYENDDTFFCSLSPQFKPNMHIPSRWMTMQLQ